ncbi:MAG TPA: MOSC N-terminal beta barrel domain-containing protein [Cyclobacteriaceae bacterium]|nr:MOSC N-terminal beta barrel domain-containing protein [Cyclobacteriaceae bacterium]
MAVYRISELYIYPVKSLGGIPVTSANVTKKGLENDRRWMLVDEQNIFLTQRIHTHMSLFKMSFGPNGFRVSYKNDHIDIPHTREGAPVRAKIWDDEVTVEEVSASHSQWFSERIGIKCKLVGFPEENARPVDQKYRTSEDDHVSLADAYPLLLLGQSTLDDLNQRLKIPVPMNRFRPSVVFTGGDAFDEDTFRNFTIGGGTFAGVKTCKRCVLITVDQETGIKGVEPLATLSTYRRWDNGVHFGQNVIPVKLGQISIGDEIIVNN